MCEAASQPMPHHVPPGAPWSGLLAPQPSHSLGPYAGRLVPSTANHGTARARPRSSRRACAHAVRLSPRRHGLSRLAEEISVELDLRTLRELQPLEELRQRLRGTDLGTDVTDL